MAFRADYLVLLDFENMKGHFFVISIEGIWVIFFTNEYLKQKKYRPF